MLLPKERMKPMRIKMIVAIISGLFRWKRWEMAVAPANPIPGQPKLMKVEKINQIGSQRRSFLKPTKILSP